jgi:RNA polymerase sigma factor (sigma-70 family)
MQTSAYDVDQIVDVARMLADRSGLIDANDREDCQQEVAIAMWLAGEKADAEQNVKAYQHTTGRGIALNTFNRVFNHNRRFVTCLNQPVGEVDGDDVEYGETLPNGDQGYVADAIDAERTGAIDAAINSLPGREAEVARAHLLTGETLTSIAEREGFSVQYAHQLLTSAKEKLASMLAEWEITLD